MEQKLFAVPGHEWVWISALELSLPVSVHVFPAETVGLILLVILIVLALIHVAAVVGVAATVEKAGVVQTKLIRAAKLMVLTTRDATPHDNVATTC